MPSINERQIDVLNGLIATTLDSAKGYGAAAKDAKNPRFKTMFDVRATQRHTLTAALQDDQFRFHQTASLSGFPACKLS